MSYTGLQRPTAVTDLILKRAILEIAELLVHSIIAMSTVVVVRSKAINHLHGRGSDRRTVCQSILIYFEARVVHNWLMTSALALNAGKCSASFHDVSTDLER